MFRHIYNVVVVEDHVGEQYQHHIIHMTRGDNSYYSYSHKGPQGDSGMIPSDGFFQCPSIPTNLT